MIYPVDLLIEDQELVCASGDETVREALFKMIDADFSQLPVVDDRGYLVGLVSEQSISRSVFHHRDKLAVLDLKVEDCSEKPTTLPVESDVLDVLSLLRRTASVVIVDGHLPVGIVTNADAIEFFRDYSEGLVLIEDMETTLKQFIEETLPTEEERETAIHNALKHMARDNAPLSYDRLTLSDYINLIANGKNWSLFEARLESKAVFQSYLDQVREIRNQLVHFRGRLTSVQYDALRRAHGWLESRARRYSSLAQTVQLSTLALESSLAEPTVKYNVGRSPGKYGPLQDWLTERARSARAGHQIEVSFDQIEAIIEQTLPESAHNHRSWWANHAGSHSQSAAWLRAGWEVANVDSVAETVVFRRTDTARYQTFWLDLASSLRKSRPGLTEAEWTGSQNWWQFGAGKSSLAFGWSFKREGLFTTYLLIEAGDAAENQRLLATLYADRESIEHEFGEKLVWDSRPDARYVLIEAQTAGSIHQSDDELERLKVWGLDRMLKLVHVFQPRIREL